MKDIIDFYYTSEKQYQHIFQTTAANVYEIL